MAFRFNFQISEGGVRIPSPTVEIIEISENENDPKERDAEEIFVFDKHREFLGAKAALAVDWDLVSESVKVLSPTLLLEDLQETRSEETAIFSKARDTHSDLIKGEYEGGLKIWEGSVDLCNYLVSSAFPFANKTILEIGCGAGLPGIIAHKYGATVHFQDYNKEVLEFSTIPNFLLNEEKSGDETTSRCRFFSGGWTKVLDKLEREWEDDKTDKYDAILTAETIYNADNYNKLYRLMKKALKPGGDVYLATKSFYFGVGGGSQSFQKLVTKDNYFKLSVCWSIREGIEREILHLQAPTRPGKKC